MNPDGFRAVEDAFLAALDLTEPQRAVYVASLGPELRSEVAGMLRGHAHADRLLPEPGTDPATGDRIGNYRIVRQIGKGGMGTVYEAARADGQYRQQVAIKVLSVQIAGAEAQARFRTERQILAVLDHPHIVRLLDGGITPGGAPYFAMELVSGGETITAFSESRKLSTADRLRLFRDVCGAIDYAHRHSVIHRDIKPSNLLVAGDGSVKVLDFGIAKVLAPMPGGGESNVTTHMAPMTPGYASPEHLRGEEVTTSSDIYSLGLVLFELLTGGRLKSKSFSLPVTRNRDLDSILLKAAAEDPAERYTSAAELGLDIGRFLNGTPVLARQATLRYVLGKSLRRNWKMVTAIAAALVLAGGAFWWQSQNMAMEKQRSTTRFELSPGRCLATCSNASATCRGRWRREKT